MNLIFVNGTMGAGKTTVCRILKNKLPPSVFADGDNLWDMCPFIVNGRSKAMVLSNIAAVLSGFLQSGLFENILFCWVMHEESIVEDILSRLTRKDFRFFLFTLESDRDTLRERLAKDVEKGARSGGVFARSEERAKHFAAMRSVKIDTTRLSPKRPPKRSQITCGAKPARPAENKFALYSARDKSPPAEYRSAARLFYFYFS